MENYIDLGRLGTGLVQGISIYNMLDQNRQNKILEARQNMLWEQQQKEYELQQENLMQMQKSEEIMQQKMQESYDQNTGRIDLKKISSMYGFVKPEIFQKYSKIASEHNQAFDEYDRDKVQDQIDYNKLAASNLENQKRVFDTLAGKLQGSLNNPIKWQNNIAIARQNGLQIDEGIEGIQEPKQREQWLNEFVTGNMTLSEQRKAQIEQENEQLLKEELERKQKVTDLETRQKEALIIEMERKSKKKELGRPLTDTSTGYIQQAVIAAGVAKKLDKKLKEVSELKKGPLSGYLLSKNPYDIDLKEIESYVNMLIPSLGRGVFREVGVLTDNDIERYRRMAATAKTDPKVALKVMQNLLNQIDETYKTYVKTFNLSGYDMSKYDKYKSVYEINKEIDKESNQWIQGEGFKYRKLK